MRKVMYGYRIGDRDLPMWMGIKPSFGLKFRAGHLVMYQVRRPVAVSLGPWIICLPKPDLGDGLTLVGGVLKRFAFNPPHVAPGVLHRFSNFVLDEVIKPRLVPLAIDTDVSVDKWLEEGPYPGWRKEELRQVNSKVVEFGPATHDQARILTFMKDEFYVEFKQARAINARKDEMKVRFGPIFKQIENVVYKMEEFIKHVPVKDRAAYVEKMLKRTGVKYICSDFVSYESLFTRDIMNACERQLYNYMTSRLPCHKEFMHYFDKYIMGRNYLRCKFFTANIDATRMSGEMCTSLGNGFTTMCVFYFVCKEVGFTGVRLVVEGDDNAASGFGRVPTPQDFARLGMVIKLEEHMSFSEMSFCGLVFDETDLQVITDPRKVLASFAWTSREYVHARVGKLKALLRCKALSIVSQYPACPVVTALGTYLMRETSGIDVRAVAQSRHFDSYQRQILADALDSRPEAREIGFGSRELVERKFGMSIEIQLALENFFAKRRGLEPISDSWIQDVFPESWKSYTYWYSNDIEVGGQTDAGFWFPNGSEQRELLLNMLGPLQSTYKSVPTGPW